MSGDILGLNSNIFFHIQRLDFSRWNPDYLQHGQLKSKSSSSSSLGCAEKVCFLESFFPIATKNCKINCWWNTLPHSLLNDQHTMSDISYSDKHTAQKMGSALYLIITSSVGQICDTASSTKQEITSSSSSCSLLVMSSITLNLR